MINIPEHVFNDFFGIICHKYEDCTECPASTVTMVRDGALWRRCLFNMISESFNDSNDTHEENK